MDRQFPRLEINMPHLRENMETIVGKCAQLGIDV